MGKYRILIVLSALFILSCRVEAEDEVWTFIVENGTGGELLLKLYEMGEPSREPIISKEDGEILRERYTDNGLPSVGDVFRTDSIVVVFNNERKETHSGSPELKSLSMLASISYEQQADDRNKYIYRITQENYDNAIPCNGPCN